MEVPLWTLEEGRSDLVLSATIATSTDPATIQIDDIRVQQPSCFRCRDHVGIAAIRDYGRVGQGRRFIVDEAVEASRADRV